METSKPATMITAIITTHHQTGQLANVLCAITPQVDMVIVVDNAASNATQKLVESHGAIWLAHEVNNLGAAQNRGISQAHLLGAEYILLLDDDSLATEGMVAALHEAFTHPQHNNKPLAMATPALMHAGTHTLAKLRHFYSRWLVLRRPWQADETYSHNIADAIASGSLLRMEAYHACGAFREDFGIDYIDKEYCLRLWMHHYGICAVRSATLLHQLGNGRHHQTIAGNVFVSHHNACRRYHISRNRILVWRSYWRHMPGYILHDACAFIYDLLRIVCFEKEKTSKLRAIWLGVVAGMSRPHTPQRCIEIYSELPG